LESPAIGERLMEEVCEQENCKQALARVKANKGSPGVEGMTIHDLPGYLKQHWPAIREQLRSETATGEAGGNPEAGRRSAKAWHSDG
jgi:RNA-directed DNA polymerase